MIKNIAKGTENIGIGNMETEIERRIGKGIWITGIENRGMDMKEMEGIIAAIDGITTEAKAETVLFLEIGVNRTAGVKNMA